jgi:hypothetical protein
MTTEGRAKKLRPELRRLIASAALALAGALASWGLARAAVSGDAIASLLGGGADPWPALCAVAALGVRLWLLFVAPGVVLYRAVMLLVAVIAARRRGPGERAPAGAPIAAPGPGSTPAA